MASGVLADRPCGVTSAPDREQSLRLCRPVQMQKVAAYLSVFRETAFDCFRQLRSLRREKNEEITGGLLNQVCLKTYSASPVPGFASFHELTLLEFKGG